MPSRIRNNLISLSFASVLATTLSAWGLHNTRGEPQQSSRAQNETRLLETTIRKEEKPL